MLNANNHINYLKDYYTEGSEVVNLVMRKGFPIPPGTYGIVHHVDDVGRIHVCWDNGVRYPLTPGIDLFAKVIYE